MLYIPRDFEPANSAFNHSVLLVSSEFMTTPSGEISGHFLDEKILPFSEQEKVRFLAKEIHSSKTSVTEREVKLKELEILIRNRALPISLGYEVLGETKSYSVFNGVPLSKRWMQLSNLAIRQDVSSSPSSSVAPLSYTGYLFVSVANSSGRSVLAPVATGHSWATPDYAGTELRKAQSNSWTAQAWHKLVDSLPGLGLGISLGSLITYLASVKQPKRPDTGDSDGTGT